MRADTALRANVRLLGDLLGRVLVEQEGAGAPRRRGADPRSRARARDGRRARRAREAVAALASSGRRRAAGVRALLPARQHRRAAPPGPPAPRVRARRAGRRASRSTMRSRGSTRPASAAPSSRGALPSVSRRARPHRPPDRGDAEYGARSAPAHRRAPRASSTTRRCPFGARAARGRPRRGDHAPLADGRGPLPPPTRRDEIRQGLWFVEQSLWNAVPRLAARRSRAPTGAPAALRFGTWIGGDLDGNPHVGPETVEDALERRGRSPRELYRARAPRARRGVGDARRASRSRATWPTRAPDRPERRRAVPRRLTSRSGSGSETTRTRTDEARWPTSTLLDRSCAPTAASGSPTGARGPARAAQVFGLHLAKLDVRVHASAIRGPDDRLRATLARRPPRSAARPAGGRRG